MIPVNKLQKLPPSQGKRKTAKIFEEAEIKLLRGMALKNEISCLTEILDYWIASLPEKQANALDSVRRNLAQSADESVIRRNLNAAKYLFLNESGHFPSEWDFDATDISGKLDPAKRRVFPGMGIYLEDIRSPFNVGAIFRCAESFGAEKIYLSPFCADPNHKRAQRTAMGCTEILPWTRLEQDPFSRAEFDRDSSDADPADIDPSDINPSDFSLTHKCFFALETGGTDLENFRFPRNAIMIIGSEELGVSPGALAAADASCGRVSVPVFGAKGSLNVSVASGIVMHAWAMSN